MTGVRRVGMAARLMDGKHEDYLELHRNVWPEVEAMVTECNIRNVTIFALDDCLLGYDEYVGDDFDDVWHLE